MSFTVTFLGQSFSLPLNKDSVSNVGDVVKSLRTHLASLGLVVPETLTCKDQDGVNLTFVT